MEPINQQEIKLIEVVEDPNPRFQLTSEHVWWTTIIIILLLMLIDYYFESNFKNIWNYILILFPIHISTTIWAWWEYRPMKHIHKEVITINLNEIIYNQQKFEFKNLHDLKFVIQDYKGERIGYPQYGAEPSFSHGVDNFIKFKFNKTPFIVQFQLRAESEKLLLGKFLLQLHLYGVTLTENLNSGRNYKETQEYKKLKGTLAQKNQIINRTIFVCLIKVILQAWIFNTSVLSLKYLI